MEYYIKIKTGKRNTAGSKAPDDIYSICENLNMRPVLFPSFPATAKKLLKKIWMYTVAPAYWINLAFKLRKGDMVVYQHPMYANRLTDFMVRWLQKMKGCHFVVLIHDLESLRRGISGVIDFNEKRSEFADSTMLKAFDFIICHNKKMKKYLINQGIEANKISPLEIFDYLCKDNKVDRKLTKPSHVVIAGNLAKGKSGYIYGNEKMNVSYNLYGINYEENCIAGNILYKGSYKPNELPMHIKGEFGLVWDGPTGETCSGNTGEYLKYNNPHKTSLYLAANMPVIIWTQAAMSDFILKNGCGITVGSLYEINDKITTMTNEEYENLRKNAANIGERLRNGYYTKKAIEFCKE